MHAVQPLEPVPRALYVPTLHCTHADDEVEPVTVLYEPETHETHEVVPLVSALYVPTAQATHTADVVVDVALE